MQETRGMVTHTNTSTFKAIIQANYKYHFVPYLENDSLINPNYKVKT